MHANPKLQIPEELRERLRSARSVFVLTGAGVSAESGVPTFRGGGQTAAVWKGMPFEVISSARMVRSNLPEVWEWFDYRRGVLSTCRPRRPRRSARRRSAPNGAAPAAPRGCSDVVGLAFEKRIGW